MSLVPSEYTPAFLEAFRGGSSPLLYRYTFKSNLSHLIVSGRSKRPSPTLGKFSRAAWRTKAVSLETAKTCLSEA